MRTIAERKEEAHIYKRLEEGKAFSKELLNTKEEKVVFYTASTGMRKGDKFEKGMKQRIKISIKKVKDITFIVAEVGYNYKVDEEGIISFCRWKDESLSHNVYDKEKQREFISNVLKNKYK